MDELNSQYPGDSMERPENGGEPRPEETADGEEPAFEMPDDTPLQEQWRFLAEEKGIAEADMLRSSAGARRRRSGGGVWRSPAGIRPGPGKRTHATGRPAGTVCRERRRREEQEREEALLARLTGGIRSSADTESFYPGAGRAARGRSANGRGGGYPAVRRLSPV